MQLVNPAPALSPLPSTAKAQPLIDAAGKTHVGRVRKTNEDAYLIATLQRSIVVHDASPEAHGWFAGEPAGTLLVVADGMGGQGGGDLASRVAVSTVSSYLLNVMPWFTAGAAKDQRGSLSDVREQLSSALVAGDTTVKSAGATSGTPHMGTTLTMALVMGQTMYVAHVGDTRCYLLRGRDLRCLTTDHTMAHRLEEVSHERLEPGSQLHHILWNALGANEDLPQPEIIKLSLEPGDALLLCSDGLTKHVPDLEITRLLGEKAPTGARCQRLVELANAGGGTDNVTVVIADLRASDRAAPPTA